MRMKIARNKLWVLTLAAGVFMLTACGQQNKKEDAKELAEGMNEAKFENTEVEDDTEWAVAVADAGLLEVEASKLALERTSTQVVKEFARTMVDDHGKVNEELKGLASQKNISLPDALSDKSQKKLNDLREKNDRDFDEAYMDCMVKEHKEAVDKFKTQAEKGEDADLKLWAAGKVAALEHHLEVAKVTEDKVNDLK